MRFSTKLTFLLLLLSIFILPGCAAQKKTKKDKDSNEMSAISKKKDKDKKKKYSDIITEDAITDEGLFTVHKVDGKYYFELPVDLLDEEILVVSRISGHVSGLNFGGAGMKSRPQQVIRWERMDNKILLRSVSYNSTATFEKPIYESLRKNNFEPVIMAFEVEVMNDDSSAAVINVDPLFTKDIAMIGAISSRDRKRFEIGGLDAKRSLISGIKSFPDNVEVRHILTYKGKKLPDNQLTGTLSVEMNQSFVKLPEIPMQPRYADARVGYFGVQQTDYGDGDLKAANKRFITRWKLEPKPEDAAAYAAGELVEPAKQIVYYVDPAMPEVWRTYIKQGIEDWQPAFEKAGFKNAIIAKDPPSKEEDPDWSPEDVRYSVIRYITTEIQNAQGPHVHDPRTGEILESDILWYHNIMKLLRNWYLTQTAAVDRNARKVVFDRELMGQLIRFVAAHEVGHTLGLPHNMGSSIAYPVDSLRSPTFTASHGTAPSIMDYARFNHIAQPGDGVTNLFPRVGEYDDWSIMYGYKLIPNVNSAEAERPILNQWIKERADDPAMRFGRQTRDPADPTAQTEDLGDDPVKSATYGTNNLKYMVPQLVSWMKQDGEDYEELEEVYNSVYGQLGKYLRHVATMVGGVYDYQKTADEEGVVYTPVEKSKQAAAMDYLNKNIFQTPRWLLDKNILQRIESDGATKRMLRLQSSVLNRLLVPDRLNRMVESTALEGNNTYTITDLFGDLKNGIWNNGAADLYQRNLQRAFVDKMGEMLASKDNEVDQTDIRAVAFGTLSEIKQMVNSRTSGGAAISNYHYQDISNRIQQILDGKYEISGGKK